ncbi:OmpH family outer membrane protein [Sulfuriroseicoccus oceanibius]|uniref:OmpH family outer membrane protein n=1 Tax=Sulfuriroseicoccus oceanibius TaxID=2707525 RepID=A0A6B3LCA2_9BACT|nr:OmpH family outer membrane protein [Sulfuriroseicoccus oceanibius]QQL46015.1 OmpH family outer membrane protein [Sulfuriroseicoccus oceanibius]
MIRKFIVTLVLGAMALGTAAAQDLKLGVVDMRQVIENYYKTKQARIDLNERQTEIQRDLDLRRAKLRDLAKQLEELKKDFQSAEMKPEFRRIKQEEYEQKFQDARALEKDIEVVTNQKRRQLQAELERMFRGIRDEVQNIVQERAKADAYDLVFDKSGVGLGGTPLMLYSKDATDFTEAVLSELNKDAPAELLEEAKEAAAEAAE